MSKQQKIEYSQLEPGFEFPPASYRLDSTTIATYIKAVEETSSLYQDTELVPPMAVAAFAMAALSERISLPGGTIHVSQELEFLDTVNVNDTITCRSKVSRKQVRGKMQILSVDLDVSAQNQKAVLAGRTSFILPEQDEDNQR